MKFRNISRFLPLLLGIALSFSACRDRFEWDGETISTLENSFAQSEFAVIQHMVDIEARADADVFGKLSGIQSIMCPGAMVTVTVINSLSTRMEINFGSATNCLDGRTRTGKLIANFSGKWKDAGSSVVITSDSYIVETYAFDFTMTVRSNFRNNLGQLNWDVDVVDAQMSSVSRGVINWESERTTTWVEGEGDLDPSTNVYEATGTAAGRTSANRNFTVNIDTPLRIEGSCQYISEGLVSITPDEFVTRTIDYGTGNCDNQALLRIGEFETVVSLW